MALSFAVGAAVASGVFLAIRSTNPGSLPPEPGADQVPTRIAPAPPSVPGGDEDRRRATQPTTSARDGAAEPVASIAERERIERLQVARLQARVRELEGRAGGADPDATGTPPRSKFHDFTDAELQALAQNCEVRFDLPRVSRQPYRLSADVGARLHLSEAEQSEVSAIVDAASKDVVAHLRAFYLEATADAAGADSLDPMSMMREILEKSPAAAIRSAREEIARERAGFPPNPHGTIVERYLRYVTSVGDSLQRALEPALGAQQAGAVRDALAESTSSMSGCSR